MNEWMNENVFFFASTHTHTLSLSCSMQFLHCSSGLCYICIECYELGSIKITRAATISQLNFFLKKKTAMECTTIILMMMLHTFISFGYGHDIYHLVELERVSVFSTPAALFCQRRALNITWNGWNERERGMDVCLHLSPCFPHIFFFSCFCDVVS